jgi:hypothetical protein
MWKCDKKGEVSLIAAGLRAFRDSEFCFDEVRMSLSEVWPFPARTFNAFRTQQQYCNGALLIIFTFLLYKDFVYDYSTTAKFKAHYSTWRARHSLFQATAFPPKIADSHHVAHPSFARQQQCAVSQHVLTRDYQ